MQSTLNFEKDVREGPFKISASDLVFFISDINRRDFLVKYINLKTLLRSQVSELTAPRSEIRMRHTVARISHNEEASNSHTTRNSQQQEVNSVCAALGYIQDSASENCSNCRGSPKSLEYWGKSSWTQMKV